MSRGPGRWQRLVLAKLAGREPFYVHWLLPQSPSVSQRHGLSRAVGRLHKAGRIVRYHTLHGILIGPPGYEPREWPGGRRLLGTCPCKEFPPDQQHGWMTGGYWNPCGFVDPCGNQSTRGKTKW